jgi:hypothetical protein
VILDMWGLVKKTLAQSDKTDEHPAMWGFQKTIFATGDRFHPYYETRVFIEKIYNELPRDGVIVVTDFADMECIKVYSADKGAIEKIENLYQKYNNPVYSVSEFETSQIKPCREAMFLGNTGIRYPYYSYHDSSHDSYYSYSSHGSYHDSLSHDSSHDSHNITYHNSLSRDSYNTYTYNIPVKITKPDTEYTEYTEYMRGFIKRFSGCSDIIKHTVNEKDNSEKDNSESKSEDNQDIHDNHDIRPFSATKLFIEKIYNELPSDAVIMVIEGFSVTDECIEIYSSDKDKIEELISKYNEPADVYSNVYIHISKIKYKISSGQKKQFVGTNGISYTYYACNYDLDDPYNLRTKPTTTAFTYLQERVCQGAYAKVTQIV